MVLRRAQAYTQAAGRGDPNPRQYPGMAEGGANKKNERVKPHRMGICDC